MDPSTDPSKNPVQDISPDPQESSISEAQPEELVSCDTNETPSPGHVSEPIDAQVADPFDDTNHIPPQPADVPTKSESAQQTDVTPAAQLKFGPFSDRYFPHSNSYRLSRDLLREIAAATLDALDDGFYYPPATQDLDRIDAEVEKDAKETGANGMKEEETKREETKGEEMKGEATKEEETKEEETKAEETKAEETKEEETKAEETKAEETKAEETKAEETKAEETKAEETKEEEEESSEEKDEKTEKGDDELSGTPDGTDEKASEGQDAMKVDIVDYRKAGREPYDLKTKIWKTNQHTMFIPPDDETLSLWFQAKKSQEEKKKSRIIIGEYSTLVGSRRLQKITEDAGSKGRIGVLNFASVKRPGGGFLNGAQAQEESLARSSTLYPSLITPTAKQFYRMYSADPDNAFYSHSMVYSPSVILFRDDKGDWTAPIEVDILTSAAVNAGDVRKQVRWEEEMRALRERVRVAELARRRELALPAFVPTHVRIYESEPQKEDTIESGQHSVTQSEHPTSVQVSPIIFASDPPSPPPEPLSLPASGLMSPVPPLLSVTPTLQSHSASSAYPHPPDVDPLTHAENLIAAAMQERIARILYLFQLQGAKHIVLGAFGTGVFQNSIELIARIFKDLLCDEENEQEEEKGKEEGEGEEGDHGEDVEGEGSPFVGIISPKCRGKFKDVFDTVMFAILGGSTVMTFKNVFEGAEGVEFDEEANDSDVEGMKDASFVRPHDGETSIPPA